MNIFSLVEVLRDYDIDSVKTLRKTLGGVKNLQGEIEKLNQSQWYAVNEISKSFSEAVLNLE